jgi:hypothetical protein
VGENGVLSSSNVISGQDLSPATAETMKEFCVSNEIHRIIPERKNYVSVVFWQQDSPSETTHTL